METIRAKNNFKLLRIRSGYSQHSLAKAANTTPGTISRIENNKSGINPKNAKAISNVLSVDFDELFEIL